MLNTSRRPKGGMAPLFYLQRDIPSLEPYRTARLIAANRIAAICFWLKQGHYTRASFLRTDLLAKLCSQEVDAKNWVPEDERPICDLRAAVELIEDPKSILAWYAIAVHFELPVRR